MQRTLLSEQELIERLDGHVLEMGLTQMDRSRDGDRARERNKDGSDRGRDRDGVGYNNILGLDEESLIGEVTDIYKALLQIFFKRKSVIILTFKQPVNCL